MSNDLVTPPVGDALARADGGDGASIEDGPRAVSSRAVRVTLFEDRAEVTRAAKAKVASGAGWVAVAGISPFVDERTVRQRVGLPVLTV